MGGSTLVCPVFTPTLQEVLNVPWEEYIDRIEKKIGPCGIAKIVGPPGAWHGPNMANGTTARRSVARPPPTHGARALIFHA